MAHFLRSHALSLVYLVSAEVAAAADVPGVANFHKVSATLYRGAQPSDVAYPELAKLGVNTVLDLRQPVEHSTRAEKASVEAAGMRYMNVPMNGFETPSPSTLAAVQAVLDTGGVVFVHCKRGRDRTGTVVAVYRMERSGWSNDKAYAEAKECGIQWYSRGMKGLIHSYKPSTALAKNVGPDAVGTPALVLSTTPDSTEAASPSSRYRSP